MTRDAILAVLRPGLPATESPFRTLRKGQFASDGLRVDVRTSGGQLLGRAHLYSSLNTDAARAVRWNNKGLARQLAAQAQELERSDWATRIQQAVQEAASQMSIDPLRGENAPPSLQQYLWARRRHSMDGIDQQRLARDWLVHAGAWLSRDERGELADAVVALARAAQELRAELIGESIASISTFYGIVRRMDSIAVEVEGDEDARLVPRSDLERQGLAVIGQAVSLLCEALPSGGTLVLPMPAVTLEGAMDVQAVSPFEIDEMDEGSTPATLIPSSDHAWLERELSREPNVVPVAPLRRQ